jgi:hypothetical protein
LHGAKYARKTTRVNCIALKLKLGTFASKIAERCEDGQSALACAKELETHYLQFLDSDDGVVCRLQLDLEGYALKKCPDSY